MLNVCWIELFFQHFCMFSGSAVLWLKEYQLNPFPFSLQLVLSYPGLSRSPPMNLQLHFSSFLGQCRKLQNKVKLNIQAGWDDEWMTAFGFLTLHLYITLGSHNIGPLVRETDRLRAKLVGWKVSGLSSMITH